MIALGLNPAAIAVRRRHVPAPRGVPLAYTMLHDFETVTGAPGANTTLAPHNGARKVLGSAGLRITGTGSGNTSLALIRDDVTADLAPFKRVMMAVDLGTPSLQPLASCRIRFRVGSTQYNPTVSPADAHQWHRGRTAISYDLARMQSAGTSIHEIGTVAKRFEFNPVNVRSAGLDIVADAAVLTGAYKPAIMLTMDDVNAEQGPGTAFYDAIQAAGLKLTVYAVRNNIGNSGKLTDAQLQQMRADGHAICMDANRNGLPIFAGHETLDELVAALAEDKADLIARGLSDAASLKHLCYSYGRVGADLPVYAPTANNATGNGTTSVALTNSAYQATTTVAPGMVVTGAGVPANTYVRKVTGEFAALLNNALPAGAYQLTFTSTPASEWWPTNMIDRLIAKGYESARMTDAGAICTAYGLDKRVSLAFFGNGIDSTGSTASYIATKQSNVAFGRDAIYYLHAPQAANMAAHWQPIIDAIKALVDAGEAVSLTVPEDMTAAFAREWV